MPNERALDDLGFFFSTERDRCYFFIYFKTPCMSSPCRNGGTCHPDYENEDYQCVCPFNYLAGKNCENCKQKSNTSNISYVISGTLLLLP